MSFVLHNASIVVDGVDLSAHCSAIEIEKGSNTVDTTGFGARGRETRLAAGEHSITATFWQDFTSGSVDETLAMLEGENVSFSVVAKPTPDATSPTNPAFTMESVLASYAPISGGVGDGAQIQAVFHNASPVGIVRSVA